MLLENMDTESIEGGVFGIFDKIGESLARLDLAGSGPEGEPFENPVSLALNKFSQEEESKPENMEILAAFKVIVEFRDKLRLLLRASPGLLKAFSNLKLSPNADYNTRSLTLALCWHLPP